MRLPRFIRYLKCKKRLIRYAVDCDVRDKYRIINSFVVAYSKRHPAIRDLNAWGYRISFRIDVDVHKRSKRLQEFDDLLDSISKRFGFCLTIGWSNMDSSRGPHYFYSVTPDSEITKITEPVFTMFEPYKLDRLREEYYEKHIKVK